MQDDLPSRRRRWPYIALLVVIPVLAGAWGAAWYYAVGRAEAAIAGWREREANVGRIHSCGSQTIGRFPFRFQMRCAEPILEIKTADRHLTFKGKDILITANLWQPTRLDGEIVGPMTVAQDGQPPAIVATWQRAHTEMRGLPVSPERVTFVLDQPVVERPENGQVQRLFGATRVELGGRMLEGSALQNPVIELSVKLVAALAPTLHAATEQPLDADIVAVLRGLKDFRPKPWQDRFREIQAAGGKIDIAQARMKQGATIATASGTLGLSRAGRLDGQLGLTVANLAAILPAFGLDGRAPQSANAPVERAAGRLDRVSPARGTAARQNVAPALVAGLSFIGKPTEIEGHRAIALPLRFTDGAVALGPIPIGQTAPLF